MSRRTHGASSEAFDLFDHGSDVGAYLSSVDSEGENGNRVLEVDLEALDPAPWQPRQYYDPQSMEDLAESIASNGLIHPMLVRPIAPSDPGRASPQRYEVVAGHRRLAALRLLAKRGQDGDSRVLAKVVVQPLSDIEAQLITYSENLDRENPSAYEEALLLLSIKSLLEATNQRSGVRALAERFRRSSGPTSESVMIAREITPDVLKAAGIMNGDAVDYATVQQMSHKALLKAAQAKGDRRLELLRSAAERIRGRDAPGAPKASRKTAARNGQSSAHAANPADQPRFTYEGLKSEGGFDLRLNRPLASYAVDAARGYLDNLLPAVAALGDTVAGDSTYLMKPAGEGLVVYFRTSPAGAKTRAQRKEPREVLETLLNALGAGGDDGDGFRPHAHGHQQANHG